MLLWIIFAVLTAAALAVVLRPLFRADAAATEPVEADLAGQAVYRDQLAEIDQDLARGVIEPAEAEQARREIARRLIRAADTTGIEHLPASSPGALRQGFVLAALVPASALAAYLWLGSPGVPSAPFAKPTGQALAKAPIEELIARVEQRLATNPNDGQGWDVIAPVYLRMERFEEAATAFNNAIRSLGPSQQRLAGFAEATVLANNGIVTEPARTAYEKLAALDPDRPEPKFWLLMAKEQDGKKDEAVAGYRDMLAKAPPDAEWRGVVAQRISQLTGEPLPSEFARAPAAPSGPSAADMEAAAKMSDEDRGKMIAGMVEGLSARLKKDGRDPAGWQRLVSAYLVLGEHDKAVAAVDDARKALADVEVGPATIQRLETMLKAAPPVGKGTK